MKHNRQDRRKRIADFKKFVKGNPPRMPGDFTHKDYRRVVDYACVAFCTGFFSGMNYYEKTYTEPGDGH